MVNVKIKSTKHTTIRKEIALIELDLILYFKNNTNGANKQYNSATKYT
jgi:hypothetical protein